MIIFAGRDGFLKKAQEHPKFAGIRSCEVRANDDFGIDVANNKIVHKIKTPDIKERGNILGAYAIAFRKDDEEPTIEIVSWDTYNKSGNGKYKTAWDTHPAEMIKKVAESHALKKAFGMSSIQSEEDFNIRGGRAMPLGTDPASDKVKEGKIVEAISDVYDNMLDRIEKATSELKLERIRKDIEKQDELRLLTPEAVEELKVKYQSKLNEIKKDESEDN
jgi:hypothetical protein